MADFVGLLRKTIEAQPQATARLRQRIYERARATVERKLAESHASPEVIVAQQAVLQQAIDEVEAYYSAVETQDISSPPSAAMTSFSSEKSQDEVHFAPDTASHLTMPNRQEAPLAPSQFNDETKRHADSHINPVVAEEADFVPFDASAFRRVERIKEDETPPLPPFEEEMPESPAPLLRGEETPSVEVSSAERRDENAQSEELRSEATPHHEIPSLASLLRENEAEQIHEGVSRENNLPEDVIGQNSPDNAPQSLAEELIPAAVSSPFSALEEGVTEQGEEKVRDQPVAVDVVEDVVGDVAPAQTALPEVLETTSSLRETARLQEELVASTQTPPPSSPVLEPAQEAEMESAAPAFLDQIAVPEAIAPQQMEDATLPVATVAPPTEDVRQDYSPEQEPPHIEDSAPLEKSEFIEEKAPIAPEFDPIFSLGGTKPEAVSSSSISPNILRQDLPQEEPQEEVVVAPTASIPPVSLAESLSASSTVSADAFATKPATPVQHESAENKSGFDAPLPEKTVPPKALPEMDMSWAVSPSAYSTALQGDGKNESEMAKARRAIEAFQMAAASAPTSPAAAASLPAQESAATSVPLTPPSAPELAPVEAAKPVPDLKPAPNLGAMPNLKSAPTLEAADILDAPPDSSRLPEVTASQAVSGNASLDFAPGDPLVAGDFGAVSDIFSPVAKREKRKGRIRQLVAVLAIGVLLVVVGGVVWFLMNGFKETDNETSVGTRPSEAVAEETEAPAVPADPTPKMTQRLLPGGRESDPGRAVDAAQTGGGMNPAVGGSTVDRHARVVYIESLDPSMPVIANEGQVEWALSRTPSEFGGLDELSIVGTVDIPDRDMTVRLSIQRNTDVTIDAAYLFYFTFVTSQNPDGETIDAIRLLFKASEQSEGQALVGAIPVKVRENFFVLALRGSRQALEHNLALMRQLPFLRLNIIYANSEPEHGTDDAAQNNNDLAVEDGEPGLDQATDNADSGANSGSNVAANAERRGRDFHIGEFSIAKDAYGDSVFKQAIDDWLVKANWAPLSPQPQPAPVPVAPSPAGSNAPAQDDPAPSPEAAQPNPDTDIAVDSDLRTPENQPQE